MRSDRQCPSLPLLKPPGLRRYERAVCGAIIRDGETDGIALGVALRDRTTARNISVDAYRIGVEYYQAIDDAKYWVAHFTFPRDEIAIRFSHRVVAIHPYPNGNGRFARMIGDLLAVGLGQPRFTWGQINLVDPSETRKAYIAALKAADAADYGPLLAFARS